MNCGIYKLEFADGSFYIGSSHQLRRRIVSHRKDLRLSLHNNRKMQKAFDSCQRNFNVKILLLCDRKELLKWEQFCIDRLQPTLNIFMSVYRLDMDLETRKKVSAGIRLRFALDPDYRKRLAQAAVLRFQRPGERERNSVAIKRGWTSEKRQKASERTKLQFAATAAREAAAKRTREQFSSVEARAARGELTSRLMTPEVRLQISESLKQRNREKKENVDASVS